MAASLRVLCMLLVVVATVTNVRFSSAALVTVTYPEPAGKPLSAQILGVDLQGYTTYALQLPETDGAGRTLAVFTETLVAGADYVSVTISAADAAASATLIEGGECSLLGGDAVCYDTDEAGRAVTRTTPIASGGWGRQVLDVATGTAQPTSTSPAAPGPGASDAQGALQPSKTAPAAQTGSAQSLRPSVALPVVWLCACMCLYVA